MLRKPSFKICKRLGSDVFEKCSSQKFAVSSARAKKGEGKGRRGGSDFGKQLKEKQKVRFAYGITEKQLANYISEASKTKLPPETLYRKLEMRLDNAVYRMGLVSTRRAARQLVSHGHILVNGRRTRVPSYALSEGDTFSVRAGSVQKGPMKIFLASEFSAPNINWIESNKEKMFGKIASLPTYDRTTGFDIPAIFEFYTR